MIVVATIVVVIAISITTGRSFDRSGGCGVSWRLQGGGTQEAAGFQGRQ